MKKKFELTNESIDYDGRKLFRIKALVSFGKIEAGEIGGYIEKEKNLDQFSNAWVSGNANVSGNASVYGNTRVYGNARVHGDAWVHGNAWLQKPTHLLQIGHIGSRNDFTTFFRTKTKRIHVNCGCFLGDIDKFEKAVEETHEGTKHEKMYKLAIELAKAQIEDTIFNEKD
jgi:hypothetical protein